MRKLFSSKKFHLIRRGVDGEIINYWMGTGIDITAKVVCKPCNEGWMSNLEDRHARPALSDLIVGNNPVPLTHSRARAIARFSFKTAVVVDHMSRDREPFFSTKVRYRFAKSLSIPNNVQMWLARYLPMGSGRLNATYHKTSDQANRSLKIYVCTLRGRAFCLSGGRGQVLRKRIQFRTDR